MLENANGLAKIMLMLINAALINNVVVTYFFGSELAVALKGDIKGSFKLGVSVSVMTITAALVAYVLNSLVLIPLNAQYMQLVCYILIVAALLPVIKKVIKYDNEDFYTSVAINSAVIGLLFLNTEATFLDTILNTVFSSVGFITIMTLMAAVSQRLEDSNVFKGFKGVAISLVSLGLVALAFTGFNGLIK